MITEDELKRIENRPWEYMLRGDVEALVAEVRRLNAAYEAVKTECHKRSSEYIRAFDFFIMMKREFDPEGYIKGVTAIYQAMQDTVDDDPSQ